MNKQTKPCCFIPKNCPVFPVLALILVLGVSIFWLFSKKQKPVGAIKAEIINGARFCQDSKKPANGFQKILKVTFSDKSEKVLYQTQNNLKAGESCLFLEGLVDSQLSPDGRYVIFSKTGWERIEPCMLNINSGKYIFSGRNEISVIREVKWSVDSQNLALVTAWDGLDGSGKTGIYVSQYNNPDKIQNIWSDPEPSLSLREIKSVYFTGNNKLNFEIDQKTSVNSPPQSHRFEFDFKTNHLEEI